MTSETTDANGPTIDQDGKSIMTVGDGVDILKRIEAIDAAFDGATGWGSWMVGCANEREALVNALAANDVHVEHRYQARLADGRRTD